MPDAAAFLLDAVERRSTAGEDRLTEIFAFALTRDVALVRWLCELADVPFGADYRVATQRLTLDEDFVDMEIVLRDRGRVVGLLLFEHKDDPLTPWQPGQPAKYVAEAARRRPDGTARVLVIVPDAERAIAKIGLGNDRWRLLTWARVAARTAQLAQDHPSASRRRWRSDAARPDAPALQMIRNELVGYLQRRELAPVPDALQPLDVLVAERLHSTLDAIDALLRFAGEAGAANGLAPQRLNFEKDRPGWRWLSFDTRDDWLGRLGGYPEVFFSSSDEWLPAEQRRHQPAFAAGYSFYPRSEAAEEVIARWTPPRDVGTFENGAAYHVVRTRYLADVALAGTYFDDQAAEFVKWTRSAITDIATAGAPASQVATDDSA